MKEVEAVKTTRDIHAITTLLEKHHGQQMRDVWVLGLNLALRISDLLSIKFSDIDNNFLKIKEGKTRKLATIKLNSTATEIIDRIKQDHPDSEFVFQSRRSRNIDKSKPNAITRQAVANAFKEVGDIVGIQLSTHSMRKTRGYMLYKKNGDITKVTKMLRHSSPAVTMRYIGITQEEIDQDFDDLVLG